MPGTSKPLVWPHYANRAADTTLPLFARPSETILHGFCSMTRRLLKRLKLKRCASLRTCIFLSACRRRICRWRSGCEDGSNGTALRACWHDWLDDSMSHGIMATTAALVHSERCAGIYQLQSCHLFYVTRKTRNLKKKEMMVRARQPRDRDDSSNAITELSSWRNSTITLAFANCCTCCRTIISQPPS